LEAVDDVPVHIGGADLKQLCFNAIYPAWLAYTDNYPLSCESVILRDDKWVAIGVREPDIDAIAHRFYTAPKKNSTAPQFRSKKIVLHIHIPNRIFDGYLRTQEAAAEAVSHPDLSAFQILIKNTQQEDFELLSRVQQGLKHENPTSFSTYNDQSAAFTFLAKKGKGKAKAGTAPTRHGMQTRRSHQQVSEEEGHSEPESNIRSDMSPSLQLRPAVSNSASTK
jgi:hypothetical protein